MLKDRLKSAAILLTILFVGIFLNAKTGFLGGLGLTMIAVVGLFMLVNGIKEYFAFSKGIGLTGFPKLTLIFGLLLQAAAVSEASCPHLSKQQPALTILTLISFIMVGFILVFRSEDFKKGLQNLITSTFGLIYICWTLSFAVKIFFTTSTASLQSGVYLIFFMIAVTKSSDIGAYFVGSHSAKRPQGNHKMFPKISPKKSWEGFVGGLVTSSIVAVLMVFFFQSKMVFISNPSIGYLSAIILAFLFTTLGFIGDIAESSFKRASKLSDSGSILPGLGGAMDVLDSLIPVAPLFYAYLVLVG